jgi:hypothetical protein
MHDELLDPEYFLAGNTADSVTGDKDIITPAF